MESTSLPERAACSSRIGEPRLTILSCMLLVFPSTVPVYKGWEFHTPNGLFAWPGAREGFFTRRPFRPPDVAATPRESIGLRPTQGNEDACGAGCHPAADWQSASRACSAQLPHMRLQPSDPPLNFLASETCEFATRQFPTTPSSDNKRSFTLGQSKWRDPGLNR